MEQAPDFRENTDAHRPDDAPLVDVPDAGDDSVPIAPSTPPDISTDTLTQRAANTATTFGDPRTMYEQALDANQADVPAAPDETV